MAVIAAYNFCNRSFDGFVAGAAAAGFSNVAIGFYPNYYDELIENMTDHDLRAPRCSGGSTRFARPSMSAILPANSRQAHFALAGPGPSPRGRAGGVRRRNHRLVTTAYVRSERRD